MLVISWLFSTLVLLVVIILGLIVAIYNLSKRISENTNDLLRVNYNPSFVVDLNKVLVYSNKVALETFSELEMNQKVPSDFDFIDELLNSTYFNVKMEVLIDECYYLINMNRIEIKGVKHIILSLMDITSLKEEKERQALMIQNISHEFKTPIAAIQGICEILIDNPNMEQDKRNDFINIIHKENLRLKSIVNRLNKAGLSPPKYQSFNMQTLIKEIDLFFENQKRTRKNIKFIIENDIKENIVQDSNIIVQIMINLLINAYKYTKEGSIKTQTYLTEDNYIVLKISDTGIGIPDNEVDKIFTRFYRAKNAFQQEVDGSGLGLSLVRELILSIGGSIEVSSKLNKGTQFTLKFKNME